MRLGSLIIIIILLLSCGQNSKQDNSLNQIYLEKETTDFKIKINPEHAILYDGYLLLIGKDSLGKYRTISINMDRNLFDSSLSNQLSTSQLSKLNLKNNRLIGYFEEHEEWKVWDGSWKDTIVINDWFYVEKTVKLTTLGRNKMTIPADLN